MQNRLKTKISKLKTIFDFDNVLSVKTDNASVSSYYRVNRLPYSLFHNRDNFIHMGISKGKKYRKQDLLEQAKIIEKYINNKTEKVLELGTGRGANSIYLAKNHQNVRFEGLDLPNGQLSYATNNAGGLKNFIPREGDFHDLSSFSNKTYDIVFIVEALCHSDRKEKVIGETKKLLKDTGVFIVIDAFTNNQKLTAEETLAKKLIEKSMTVAEFENYKNFCTMLRKNMFEIIFEEDDSLKIIPSLKRFEKDASILLSLPRFIAKLVIKIFPSEFTFNTIAGYLMPDLIENNVAKYMVVVSKIKKG